MPFSDLRLEKILRISFILMILLSAFKIHEVSTEIFDKNFHFDKINENAFAEAVQSNAPETKNMSEDEKRQGWKTLHDDEEKNCKDNNCSANKIIGQIEQELKNSINAHTPPASDDQTRQEALKNAETNLDSKLNTLDKKIEYLHFLEKNKNDALNKNVEKLVKIYEQMPPREAASIFNIMDLHVLVMLSTKMNARKISAVMGYMYPERANLVSQYMVGIRNFRSQNYDQKQENFLFLSRNPNIR